MEIKRKEIQIKELEERDRFLEGLDKFKKAGLIPKKDDKSHTDDLLKTLFEQINKIRKLEHKIKELEEELKKYKK